MVYYIIKNKVTGEHLPYPQRGTKNRTHVELTKHAPPRLFSEKRAATRALNWWLSGKFRRDFKYGNRFEDTTYYDVTIPVLNRVAQDMTIIQVEIKERYAHT